MNGNILKLFQIEFAQYDIYKAYVKNYKRVSEIEKKNISLDLCTEIFVLCVTK